MKKMNTKGQKVIKKYKKVKKWEDCAAKCQENKKCTAWTYRPKMKKQKQPLLCTVLSIIMVSTCSPWKMLSPSQM